MSAPSDQAVRAHLADCEVVIVCGDPPTVYHPDYEACGLRKPDVCNWSRCREVWGFGRSVRERSVVQGHIEKADLDRIVREVCSIELPVRGFSPCERPFGIVTGDGSQAALFENGRFVGWVRLRKTEGWSRYRFFLEGELGDNGALSYPRQEGPRLGLLMVRFEPARGKPEEIEVVATLVHEQFHASFQRIPVEDVSVFTSRYRGSELDWVPDRARTTLENRFDQDIGFARGLERELADLVLARRELEDGNRGSSLSLLGDFLEARKKRRAGMTPAEGLYEQYWEYVEGTAQMMEFEAVKGLFGVDRYPTLENASRRLNRGYFLLTGALLTDIVWMLSPQEFQETVIRGRVADLEGTLRKVLSTNVE